MSAWLIMAIGVAMLIAYVGVLVRLDREAEGVVGKAHDDASAGAGNLGWAWTQYVLLIGGHFLLVVGVVKAILGFSPAYGPGVF